MKTIVGQIWQQSFNAIIRFHTLGFKPASHWALSNLPTVSDGHFRLSVVQGRDASSLDGRGFVLCVNIAQKMCKLYNTCLELCNEVQQDRTHL